MILSYLALLLVLMPFPSGPAAGLEISGSNLSDTARFVEKVYLHVDRDRYFPGDNIWFKAYLIDASDRLLTSHISNLHVELISPDMKITDSRIVKMIDGLGKGDFSLPQTIKSGKYKIRAYTNYMRNFGEQLFYFKDITIINTADAVKTFTFNSDSVRNKLEISFFPEGGSLIGNVASKVAFKATDANGEGCDVTGEIRTSTGEVITTFKSSHKGMGVFSINPLSGKNYYALVKDQFGDSIDAPLPASFPTGIVLNILKDSKNNLQVTVRTNAETFSALHENNLSLIVSSRNVFLKKADFRMKSLSDRFLMPVNDLPEGIVSLTLTGAEDIPLCERLVYIKNNDDVHLNLETDKSVYNQRDSVSLIIMLTDSSVDWQDAFLSLSASKIISGGSSDFPSSISSWFLLESDVKGIVEEPSYYFDSSNPDRLRDLDLLLMTQGWRDFKWKYHELRYPPEHGFLISGRTRKKFIKDPLINEHINLALFRGGNPLINTVITDSAGRFTTEEFDMTGKAELIASSTGKKEKPEGWIILDSLRYLPAELNPMNSVHKYAIVHNKSTFSEHTVNNIQVKNENLTSYIQYAEIRNSTLKKYKLSDTINPGEVTITARRREYPDTPRALSHKYLMANSPDKEYEIIPKTEIFINNNLGLLINFKLHTNFGGTGGGPVSDPPLVLLNGMEVTWEDVASVPVNWIGRWDWISPATAYAMWGYKGRAGVISVIYREGAPTETFNKVFHTGMIKFSGYSEPRIFYSPKHHTSLEKDYKPDLRTTLFWEPDIVVQNNKGICLNYFNGDIPSKVKIVVEGITNDGIPITGRAEYEVK